MLAGCTGGTYVEKSADSPQGEPPAQPRPQVDLTLADPFEAEILSLCLSESLLPVAETTDEILYDLAAIRSAYGYEALVRTRARTGWTGEIEIKLDEMAAHEVASGHYPFWRELNEDLGPVRILPLDFGHVVLHFGSAFNPCLAAEQYAELPGVIDAAPVFDTELDGPEIFIGFHVHFGYTYLFRYAWGNCDYGCQNEEYYYFRFHGDNPVLVGRWNPATGAPPAWWTEAEEEWIECSCPPRLPEPPDRRRIRSK
jgi:hypothetical protein